MENNIVAIWLWNREVGRIYWDDASGRAVFAYNPAFLHDGIDIAPLTASIHSLATQKPILGDRDKLYQGLPPFLADSCLTSGVILSLRIGVLCTVFVANK